jgi:hypothetical protein
LVGKVPAKLVEALGSVGMFLLSLWRRWALWEEGISVVACVVKESKLPDQILNLKADS